MKKNLTKETILELAKNEGIKFIRLQFCDIFGQLKNVTITVSQLEKALDNKCMFDGSSIEGFVRIEESDMYLFPDMSTFEFFPFVSGDGKTARLICDVYRPNGEPFIGDSRYALKQVLQEAKDMGYKVNVGPECEFFLFENDEYGAPTLISHDRGGYFDMSPVGQGGSCRRDICLNLEEMNFDIETSHHECAPAQHEIDFKYADALTAADNIMTFKMVVKSIALKHGYHASFMPKPKFGMAGSGMHINISLFDEKTKTNAFYDDSDEMGLSKIAKSFIAGIMSEVTNYTAIINPLVNSYKRLVPDYEAPVYIAWSGKNRSPLIRVPAAKGASTRVELRSPDPSCNPYLALAIVIASGLKGIKEKMMPPHSIDKNIFDMTKAERVEAGINCLPDSLEKAIDNMENSKFVRSVLGEHIFTKYIEAKHREWDEYRVRISQWEIDNYYGKY